MSARPAPKPIQFFTAPWRPDELLCLTDDGSVWVLVRTGFGDDGRGWPRVVEWHPIAKTVIPPFAPLWVPALRQSGNSSPRIPDPAPDGDDTGE